MATDPNNLKELLAETIRLRKRAEQLDSPRLSILIRDERRLRRMLEG